MLSWSGSMTRPLDRVGHKGQQAVPTFHGWLAVFPDLAPSMWMGSGDTEAEVLEEPRISPSSLPSAPDTLMPTIWGKPPNTFGSSHLSLYNPSGSSLGKGYLEIALVWWSEWVTCKTQTQTIFWNFEAFQNCSLTLNSIFGSGKCPSSNRVISASLFFNLGIKC